MTLPLPPALAQAKAEKPNVVVMMVDNLGWGELGVYGGGILRAYRGACSHLSFSFGLQFPERRRSMPDDDQDTTRTGGGSSRISRRSNST
jgi:hypothetical protein